SELAERVRLLGLYADKIIPKSVDGVKIISKYCNADSFIYADPPYFEKAGSLYLNAFGEKDHEKLAKALNGRSNGSWLLTYDNVPRVHELYAKRRRRKFHLNYSAHRVIKATEIAVLSDRVADVPDGWTAVTA
ncbi:MAG TPA: DNA adenine methylase, partial [Solirubrobacterales bacterium]|nr:DNA adenine methylase [Solirubrobacterales bacterium]